LPLKSLVATNQAYQLLQKSDKVIQQLHERVSYFKSNLSENAKTQLIKSESAIQCIVLSGNDQIKKLATALQNCGYDIRPILSPTVSKGKERLRICIHVFNTFGQIQGLCDEINGNFK
jgi:8-amino-7-oxononanoate synthase